MRRSTGLIRKTSPALGAALLPLLLLHPAPAAACGCFAPPDPTAPVVQSGENILFYVANGQVTAHIQIQYAGDAKDFGWLLPLPSVPTLEVGSDDVFRALINRTGPGYREVITYPRHCEWPPSGTDFGAPTFTSPDFGAAPPSDGGGGGGPPPSPLVVEGGIGPYDYAVLKADSKKAMLDWLAANRYFVPAGTDDVVAPYIHPGAFFLALRLHSGQSAGDIQPVVVHYASDLPMIPLVLTSVTASANLGVWVWVLGPARAIPRNYHHVVVDDAALDWSNGTFTWTVPRNYEAVVSRAVKSAPGKHAFVTELATPAAPVVPMLFLPGRFGDLSVLRASGIASVYLAYLRGNGYNFDSALITVLQKYIKQPPALQSSPGVPVPPVSYYANFNFWFTSQPAAFEKFDLSFDPVALTNEIEEHVIKPVRAAEALFAKAKYLTRLHTWLAPEDMTADPVFSFNPSLPDVSGQHLSALDYRCGRVPHTYLGKLTTEHGFVVDDDRKPIPLLPWAERIEILRESGPPEVVTDNAPIIRALLALPAAVPDGGSSSVAIGGGGCAVSGAEEVAGLRRMALLAALIPLALLLATRRRRRR